jgi:hypothetical protein
LFGGDAELTNVDPSEYFSTLKVLVITWRVLYHKRTILDNSDSLNTVFWACLQAMGHAFM